jgi:hypothetical protein
VVSEDVTALISEDIQANRERYLGIMHDHGAKSPEDIIDSVRQTQADLLALYRTVSDDVAQRQPAPGEWSMRELAIHSVFTERLIAKIIHHASRGEVPSAEDLEGAGIGMMPKDDDGRSYADILNDLDRTNEELIDAVRSLPKSPNKDMKLPHPFFGPLTCLEWAGFQRVHDLDHVQHARKILTAVN